MDEIMFFYSQVFSSTALKSILSPLKHVVKVCSCSYGTWEFRVLETDLLQDSMCEMDKLKILFLN